MLPAYLLLLKLYGGVSTRQGTDHSEEAEDAVKYPLNTTTIDLDISNYNASLPDKDNVRAKPIQLHPTNATKMEILSPHVLAQYWQTLQPSAQCQCTLG